MAATSARCDFEQMFLRDAIESAANKRFGDALSSYEAIIVCNKSYSEQAAIAACNCFSSHSLLSGSLREFLVSMLFRLAWFWSCSLDHNGSEKLHRSLIWPQLDRSFC